MDNQWLLSVISTSLQRLSPCQLVQVELNHQPIVGRIHLLAAGKAAVSMTMGALAVGQQFVSALVVCPHGVDIPAGFPFPVQTASHPLPDTASFESGGLALQQAASLDEGDALLVLLSGGASALLENPAPGLPAESIRHLFEVLLTAGLPIAEMNILRKHASAIKGGQLAATAWPATTRALIISDVPVNQPEMVSSGPTYPDPTTIADALELLEGRGLASKLPVIHDYWKSVLQDLDLETIKPDDSRLSRTINQVILDRKRFVQVVAENIQTHHPDVDVRVLREDFDLTVTEMVSLLDETALTLQPGSLCLLAGELTLKVTGGGCGGRNQELVARMLQRLPEGITLLSFASDGGDGVTPVPVAGGFVDDNVRKRLAESGLEPSEFLARNDSYPLLKQLQAHIHTGPTGHNLGDLIIMAGAGFGGRRA